MMVLNSARANILLKFKFNTNLFPPMLPLYLLNAIKGVPIIVEQKNRTVVEGVLENVDNWMNITLKAATITDLVKKTKRSVPDIYIRGVQIKLIKMPNDVVDHYKEQQLREKENQNRHNNRNRRFNNNNNNSNTNSNNQRRGANNGNNNNNNGNNNNNNNNNNRNNRGNFNRNQQQSQPTF